MAFLAVSWGISCALLAVNVIMRIINAAIAGWAFNRNMDRASTDSTDFGGLFQELVLFLKRLEID